MRSFEFCPGRRADAFFPTSVAIFATNLLDAIPIELGRSNSCKMPAWRSPRNFPGRFAQVREIQECLIYGDLFKQGGQPAEAFHDLFGEFAVQVVPRRDDDQVLANS